MTRRRSSGIREGREEVGTEDDEEEKDEVKGDEDTVVPREARLLCDAQGKLSEWFAFEFALNVDEWLLTSNSFHWRYDLFIP